ncbi:MAG TPA: hypothetical protein VGB17_02960 [Pyrinomonadaceae bacterium]|jgi:ABC-type transporter MlaC component
MKRTLLLITFILALSVTIAAQGKQEAPQPSIEQQRAIAEAITQAEASKKDLDAAQARYEASQAKLTAVLYRIMALLKLSPDEYKPVMSEGGLKFEKIEKKE